MHAVYIRRGRKSESDSGPKGLRRGKTLRSSYWLCQLRRLASAVNESERERGRVCERERASVCVCVVVCVSTAAIGERGE